MFRIFSLFLAFIFSIAFGGSNNVLAPTAVLNSEELPYSIETVTEGLNVPWEMDIAADGRIFLTERPGVIRLIDKGKLVTEPVFAFTAPFLSRSEGGLLGLALDPQFTTNHYIYVYHSYDDRGVVKNRVLRFKENNNKAILDKILLADIPGNDNHNGGRIKIGPDNLLYITAGDIYQPPLAQNLQNLGGKILRIGLDGSIPASNPFSGSPVYSLGHRNPQGLAWHPVTGKLYSAEHGQSAHDEINLIEPGANYGWPLIEGDESTHPDKKGLKTPLIHSGKETWAPSGMAFITKGPWRGSLLIANLRGTQVLKVTLQNTDYTKVEKLQSLFKDWGRIRNVYEAKNGSIYIMTNNRDGRGTVKSGDDKLLRLNPKF